MTKLRALPCLLVGVLAWTAPAGAQEKEGLPSPKELPPIVEKGPVVEAAPPPVTPGCDAACHPPFKVLWVETATPLQVLVPREVITTEPRKALEIEYREEKRVVTEIVMKPREVEEAVPCTIVCPVKVVDPHTGECSTVMQPVTEVKIVKRTVFEPAPEERTIIVRVPALKSVDVMTPQKTILLEYRTDMLRGGYGIRVPAEEEPRKPEFILAPKPPCPPELVEPAPQRIEKPAPPRIEK
jgi:hypothetical protein